jgi:hypothetical protein
MLVDILFLRQRSAQEAIIESAHVTKDPVFHFYCDSLEFLAEL